MNNSKIEIVGYILIVALILLIGGSKFVNVLNSYKENYNIRGEKKVQVEDLRLKLQTIEAAATQRAQSQDVLKPFFQQDSVPSDSIASFGGMFEDIVDYVKMNGLLLRSIKYNINPPDDLIFVSFASSYNVCGINLYVVGTYPQLQNFLNAMFEYPYYINIVNIDSAPYERNKAYLIAKITINLYSKK